MWRNSNARSGRGVRAGASEDAGAVSGEAAGDDRLAGGADEVAHEGQVVEAEEADRGQLLGAGEVAEVVAVVAPAGGTGAAGGDRLAVALPARLAQVEPEAVAGVGDERRAVAGQPGRDRAVEDVEAEPDAGQQVVDVADPEQVLGRLFGEERGGQLEHAPHLLLVAAEGAADRQAV